MLKLDQLHLVKFVMKKMKSSTYIQQFIVFNKINILRLKLFSVAEDMKLVEYDVIEFKSTTDRSKVDPYDRLKIKSVFPVNIYIYIYIYTFIL